MASLFVTLPRPDHIIRQSRGRANAGPRLWNLQRALQCTARDITR
jgi:hypothetical protein